MKQYGHSIKAFFSGALITTMLTTPLISTAADQRQVDLEAIKQKELLNLFDVYELAVRNDAAFLAAEWKKKAGMQTTSLTKALFLPKIQVSVNTTLNDSETEYLTDKNQNQNQVTRP